jgi:hypothetical protein
VSSIIFLGATLFTVSIIIISPVAPLEGRREPTACDKKEYGLMGEKGRIKNVGYVLKERLFST